ncbi:hypothetical protein L1887_62332 [Cichorium endivia]|nr:hypothetical protein L1887_62332 [Cichorium endivia]
MVRIDSLASTRKVAKFTPKWSSIEKRNRHTRCWCEPMTERRKENFFLAVYHTVVISQWVQDSTPCHPAHLSKRPSVIHDLLLISAPVGSSQCRHFTAKKVATQESRISSTQAACLFWSSKPVRVCYSKFAFQASL